MLHFLQGLTVLFGAFATIIPAYFAVYFWVDGKGRIGRVLSYMLAGEAISMAVATYFSLSSFIHIYNTMSPEQTIILRWIIFTTGLFSTVHLILHIIKTQKKLV